MRSTVEHRHGHHSEHGALDAPEVQGRERELHRAADGHAGHAAEHDHAAHADVYKRRFWVTLILAIPVVVYSEMIQDWFGYHGARVSGRRLGRARPRHRHLPLRRIRLPLGRVVGDPPAGAGDDAARLARDHRRVRRERGLDARTVRSRVLVGAVGAGRDHAVRALAGDEGARPGPRRGQRARRAAAGRGRARPRWHRRPRPDRRAAGRRRRARAAGRPRARRRRGRRRSRRARRVDDHGRVEARGPGRGRRRHRRHRRDRLCDPRPRDGRRRGDGARRYPAARHAGAGVALPHPGARGPGRRTPLLRRRRVRDRGLRRLGGRSATSTSP